MRRSFFLLTTFLIASLTLCAQTPLYTSYVNPLIGTDGMGHCFPGACVPFGAVQLSPDNDTIPHNVNGRTLEVEAPGVSDRKCYVKAVLLNGKPYSKLYITHADLLQGGKLTFIMSATPNKRRGLSPADKPYSLTAD